MDNDAVVERLDRILSLLRVAHADKIGELRNTIRGHAVDAALLDGALDWTPAGDLRRSVAKKADQTERNVNNRIGDLLALGVLEKQGAGRATCYRSTGLI